MAEAEVFTRRTILDYVMQLHYIRLMKEIYDGCKCTGPDAD